MLKFPDKLGDRHIGVILNPNVYNNKNFLNLDIIDRLRKAGTDMLGAEIMTFAAYVREDGKVPTKKMLTPYILELLEYLDTNGFDTLLVANAGYFKFLTGLAFEASVGGCYQTTLESYEHINIVPIINPIIARAQPGKRTLMDKSFSTAADVIKGTFDNTEFAFDLYEEVKTIAHAKEVIAHLKEQKVLAWDIETTGLHHINDELVTQAFATSEKEAFTFIMHEKFLGSVVATEMHKLLKDFFLTYVGKIIVHNFGFESKFLMNKYVMNDYKDYNSMSKFLKRFDWEDTMLIGYSLFNSTDRISLSLKDMAKDKYGDWDSDIDVRDAINQPIDKLAYYNAIDVSATFYLFNKYYKQMEESQRNFYNTEMKETQVTFTKIMCTGIPVDMDKVHEGEQVLKDKLSELNMNFYQNMYVRVATEGIIDNMVKKYNESHKVKQVTSDFYGDIQFNVNSTLQLRELLFDKNCMNYQAIDFTKTKQPKTDRATLEELLETETDDEKKEVLEALIGFSETSIILNTFISTFKRDSVEVDKDTFRLYGNLRVGGTISFRPTASNPNLLNMPSGSTYGKIIKDCFKAPKGFIIGTSDHASLQGRTGANLTADPALIKIYGEDIDLHSYMTVRYWPENFDADHPETPEYYNWVKDNFGDLRQTSKGITFACQFGGGPAKIAKMLKVPKEEGYRIWKAYKDTYPGVARFGKQTSNLTKKDGYLELGLGLRLQTPTLTKTARNVVENLRRGFDEANALMKANIKAGLPAVEPTITEQEVNAAEGRLAGDERSAINARTQFWDFLTIQGLTKFYNKIEEAGYEGQVIPHATIYDSIYGEFSEDPEIIEWANNTMIECMIEDYTDPQPVKLVANLDIGPSWKTLKELPNNCSLDVIKETLSEVMV